jgi:hypothetical protein
MRRWIMFARWMALVVVSFTLLGETHVWKTGKVLDSQSTRRLMETGMSSTATTNGAVTGTNTDNTVNATTTTNSHVHYMAIQDTQLLIAGDGYSYVVDDSVAKSVGLPTHAIVTRSIMNRKHGCRFIIGDDVRYAQEKSKLFVLDADGKECKLDIVRQERVQR